MKRFSEDKVRAKRGCKSLHFAACKPIVLVAPLKPFKRTVAINHLSFVLFEVAKFIEPKNAVRGSSATSPIVATALLQCFENNHETKLQIGWQVQAGHKAGKSTIIKMLMGLLEPTYRL